MSNIVVIGSGMAGMGAAHRLHAQGIRPVIVEKSPHYGGHTSSFRNEQGFLFDLGPHISFTKDRRIQDLLADNVRGEYESIQIYLNNYWNGYWLTHPVQLHMHGLPEDLIVATRNQQGLRARTPEWLLLSRGLAREYVDGEGRAVSHVTDETTNRALWRHYCAVMTEP